MFHTVVCIQKVVIKLWKERQFAGYVLKLPTDMNPAHNFSKNACCVNAKEI
jgi:hypothetical protein